MIKEEGLVYILCTSALSDKVYTSKRYVAHEGKMNVNSKCRQKYMYIEYAMLAYHLETAEENTLLSN